MAPKNPTVLDNKIAAVVRQKTQDLERRLTSVENALDASNMRAICEEAQARMDDVLRRNGLVIKEMRGDIQRGLQKAETQVKEATESLKAFEKIDDKLSRRFEDIDKKFEAGIMKVKELEGSLEALPARSAFTTCCNDVTAMQKTVAKIEKKLSSQNFIKPKEAASPEATSSLPSVSKDITQLKVDVFTLQCELGNISREIVKKSDKDDPSLSIEEDIAVSKEAAFLRRRGTEGRSRSNSRDSRSSTYSAERPSGFQAPQVFSVRGP